MSDIHIRRDRIEEYKEILEDKLLKKLEEEEEGLIIIVGDILHEYDSYSPECLEMVCNLIKNLSKIMPLIIIPGNHDANVRNTDRLDALTPIIKILNISNVHYLSKSGEYIYGNIVFGVSSILDNNNEIIKLSDNYENKIKICLHHGMIRNCINKLISNNTDITELLNNYDIVMLGDIHKYHYLDNNKIICYSGSLIQQNHGEEYGIHGYIKWDIIEKTSIFKKVNHNYGFCTIEIRNNELISYDLPDKVRLRIRVYDSDEKYVDNIIKDLGTKHKILSLIPPIYETKKIEELKNIDKFKMDDIYLSALNEILKKKSDNINKQEIREEFINSLKDEQTRLTMNYKLIKLKFSNMLIYGENNEINFSNMNGLIGILAPNGYGKSALIDIILYSLYGESSRTKSTSKSSCDCIINNKKNKYKCELKLQVNGKIYIIKRTGTRGSKHSIELFYMDAENEINITEKNKKETQNSIERLVGNYNEMTTTNIILQNNDKSIINFDNKTRKEYMSNLFGMDWFKGLCEKEKLKIRELKDKDNYCRGAIGNITIKEIKNKISNNKNILSILGLEIEQINDLLTILDSEDYIQINQINQYSESDNIKNLETELLLLRNKTYDIKEISSEMIIKHNEYIINKKNKITEKEDYIYRLYTKLHNLENINIYTKTSRTKEDIEKELLQIIDPILIEINDDIEEKHKEFEKNKQIKINNYNTELSDLYKLLHPVYLEITKMDIDLDEIKNLETELKKVNIPLKKKRLTKNIILENEKFIKLKEKDLNILENKKQKMYEQLKEIKNIEPINKNDIDVLDNELLKIIPKQLEYICMVTYENIIKNREELIKQIKHNNIDISSQESECREIKLQIRDIINKNNKLRKMTINKNEYEKLKIDLIRKINYEKELEILKENIIKINTIMTELNKIEYDMNCPYCVKNTAINILEKNKYQNELNEYNKNINLIKKNMSFFDGIEQKLDLYETEQKDNQIREKNNIELLHLETKYKTENNKLEEMYQDSKNILLIKELDTKIKEFDNIINNNNETVKYNLQNEIKRNKLQHEKETLINKYKLYELNEEAKKHNIIIHNKITEIINKIKLKQNEKYEKYETIISYNYQIEKEQIKRDNYKNEIIDKINKYKKILENNNNQIHNKNIEEQINIIKQKLNETVLLEDTEYINYNETKKILQNNIKLRNKLLEEIKGIEYIKKLNENSETYELIRINKNELEKIKNESDEYDYILDINRKLELERDNNKKQIKDISLQIEKYYMNKLNTQIYEWHTNIKNLKDATKKRKIQKLIELTKLETEEHEKLKNNIKLLDKLEINYKEIKILENEKIKHDILREIYEPSGIPEIILQNMKPIIEEEINKMLSTIVNYNIVIPITNNDINIFKLGDNNEKTEVMNCSGSEKFAIDLCLRCVLSKMNNICNSNYMIIDEGFVSFDTNTINNTDNILSIIKEKYDYVLVISHLEKLNTFMDKYIPITKLNNNSQIQYI